MLDFPLILRVKLTVVDRIQPQGYKVSTGVENIGYSLGVHAFSRQNIDLAIYQLGK